MNTTHNQWHEKIVLALSGVAKVCRTTILNANPRHLFKVNNDNNGSVEPINVLRLYGSVYRLYIEAPRIMKHSGTFAD